LCTSRIIPLSAAISASASSTARTRSGGASRPAASGGCNGSMWVSTSTGRAELLAERRFQLVGNGVGGAQRQLRSTSRSSETERFRGYRGR
jgi:hypothetical protein